MKEECNHNWHVARSVNVIDWDVFMRSRDAESIQGNTITHDLTHTLFCVMCRQFKNVKD